MKEKQLLNLYRDEGTLGKVISNEAPRYDSVMFYKEGILNNLVNTSMLCVASLSEDLFQIKEMWQDSLERYPDSWWVRNLEPIVNRNTAREVAPVTARVLKAALITELERMQEDGGLMLRYLAKPDSIFEDLKTWAYRWKCEL